MGKKSAKKKERKLVKAKSDTFVGMEKKFRDLERRLDDIFSENCKLSIVFLCGAELYRKLIDFL